MADPYFDSNSLYSRFQEAYESVMPNERLAFKNWPQQRGLVFGLRVDQTAPSKYVNPLIPYGESFHNPLSDSRFKKMPVRVIYSQESEQSETLELSHKPRAYQEANQNTRIITSQPELRIDQAWSMVGEANSHSDFLNVNHPLLASSLKNTTGNSFSGSEKSTSQSSSVVDIHHNSGESSNPLSNNQNYDYPFSTPMVPISIIPPQLNLNSEQLQRNAFPAGNELDFGASASVSSDESLTIPHDKAYEQSKKRKAYRQSEKRKAYMKAYFQSEKGKASRKAYMKAYRESEKGKAARKAYRESKKGKATRAAYEQSEKRKASHKAWAQSAKEKAYRKAYNETLKNTGSDQEQTKIAGKQADSFVCESNKARNNEPESTSISPLLPAF